ncbi:hypothetical protein [Phenylobacterium sp.]|uniref:hypothetical protein n=1 Tax=Phenylobacterium sp. TaxID=1871053 RepID=UPI0011FB3EC2|nr:hypothetical protein [Phenylobacterium sp.]THD59874.1 MAG: hypothetical protein E8A49_15055 [Phenylobacterium sp.]
MTGLIRTSQIPTSAAIAVLAVAVLALTACEKGKPRHPPPDPMALPDAPEAPAPVRSTGLPKSPQPAAFSLDQLGATASPLSKPTVTAPANQPLAFSGFAYDAATGQPARGVDLVIDGQAHGTAYGAARPDVARYFKSPALLDVAFKATLPAGSLTVGAHTLLIRVVSADGKSYAEGQAIPFQLR